MAHKGTGAARLGQPTLTAADWAEAALQLIAESGVQALTIETLASRLGVTKGSFYWHFKTRADLLDAALQRWEQRGTEETAAGLAAITDPRRRLEVILDASLQPPRARSLYAALAEAAGQDSVRRALDRVASKRIAYLETCYRELGNTEPLARAVFAYAAYRGLLQLAHEAPAALPADWPSYRALVRDSLIPPTISKTRKAKTGKGR